MSTRPADEIEVLSRTAAGLPVPPATERARPLARFESRIAGWVSAVLVALLALFFRLWRLGTPKEFEFDETYYAKDAWSMLQHGYVREYVEDADKMILAGNLDGIFEPEPSMIVHPEAGKWMIAAGEHFFGMTPFGWRVSAAIVGALMVLVMCRLVRRLTGSNLLGCVAGLLLCFDGQHLVLSRLGLLDIFLAFWILSAVACLVADRDWTRARMIPDGSAWGPRKGLWFRPWRLAAGVCFGLAIATKWSALYPLAAFGLLVWFWDAGARRAIGVRFALARSALVDAVPAFGHLVVVAFLVYVASWTGWLMNAHEYEEHRSSSQYTQFVSMGKDCEPVTDDSKQWPTAREPDASGLGELVQSLRSLAYYHHDVYVFHTNFLDCSDHTYRSDPEGWLVLNRPVGVNVENDIQPGQQGCMAAPDSHCIREVLLLGTPVLWWGATLALIYAGIAWIGKRDWRYGLAVIGALGLWLPWEMNDTRPIFSFYASAVLPFMIIALTMVMGELLGRSRAASTRRTVGTIITGSFFVLVLLNFAWFWPIWTNELLTYDEWTDRIWFSRWI